MTRCRMSTTVRLDLDEDGRYCGDAGERNVETDGVDSAVVSVLENGGPGHNLNRWMRTCPCWKEAVLGVVEKQLHCLLDQSQDRKVARVGKVGP